MTYDDVKEYYGKVLQKSEDLQTNACCTGADMPDFLKPIMSKLHDEVVTRYYGCGLVLPEQLEGTRILDLGSGSGRDVYALSALVGETGEVVGVDMTEEQLEVARRHVDFHADAFGYKRPNVRFLKGYIERLDELDLEPDCEDYGQAVVYRGTIPHHPNSFRLDKHHDITRGKVFPVCGNTLQMLRDTRFREHFDYIGSGEIHYGLFDGCGKTLPFESGSSAEGADTSSGGCC